MTAAMKFNDPQRIPGLTPWACDYDGPNGRCAIILYASDPEQILRDHSDLLRDLVVRGECAGIIE